MQKYPNIQEYVVRDSNESQISGRDCCFREVKHIRGKPCTLFGGGQWFSLGLGIVILSYWLLCWGLRIVWWMGGWFLGGWYLVVFPVFHFD